MGSLYLNNLNNDERKNLEKILHETQKGNCFICEKEVDLHLHAGAIDVDHIEPIKTGGKDDPSNFALTHASCNRSKQATNLRVARVLARYSAIRDSVASQNRGPNLSDIFSRYGGAIHELPLVRENGVVSLSFPQLSRNDVQKIPLYKDDMSGLDYFFAKIPIQYLYHDDRINPRAVGSSLGGLVEEFYKKRPQLHVALAWAQLQNEQTHTKVHVFDGQHKATAQVLLGVRELPVRIFLNPDLDILLTTNTNAGTGLRQVAFDKSVQRHLGSALYTERIESYRKDLNLADDDYTFSEKDLMNYFKGEWREIGRYILDAVRDTITHSADNKLTSFIDFGGKATERPLSYSTIEKTFYSFFIFSGVLETPLDYRIDEGENPRELEKEQILRLMNLVAHTLYISQFDVALGTSRIENKVQKGDDVPESHLRAFRLSKEEILYSWLRFVKQIIQNYFITNGVPFQEAKSFQYKFPEPLWDNIENFLENLKHLPLWINRNLSQTVFGGKQNYDFWQKIFETGKTPQGQQAMPAGINLMHMIQPHQGVIP